MRRELLPMIFGVAYPDLLFPGLILLQPYTDHPLLKSSMSIYDEMTRYTFAPIRVRLTDSINPDRMWKSYSLSYKDQ